MTPIYYIRSYEGFHKWGYPMAGWFVMKNPNLKQMITGGTPSRKPPYDTHDMNDISIWSLYPLAI